MPVPSPNLYPEFNIVRLSHVELQVSDLGASKEFYTSILGLQVTYEDSVQVCLRAMEERGHHCLVLVKGDSASVSYIAFKVFDDDDLEKLTLFFQSKNLACSWVERCLLYTSPSPRDRG